MLLNSRQCKCGINQSDIKFDKYYQYHGDDAFYGGQIDMIGERTCECGRNLKGYFKRDINQKLILLDLEVIKDITNDEKIENTPTSCEENLVLVDENVTYNPKSYDEMDYRELQSICKEKGINTFQKSKEYMIAELKKATGIVDAQ